MGVSWVALLVGATSALYFMQPIGIRVAIVGASTVASSVSSLLMLGWLRYIEQQQR
jgi:hypothetical protein